MKAGKWKVVLAEVTLMVGLVLEMFNRAADDADAFVDAVGGVFGVANVADGVLKIVETCTTVVARV